MNDLNMAQQVFAVFYAIFFGTMLSMLGGRKSLPEKGNGEHMENIKQN